jgi:hemerythrin-like domain-containing protein
MLASGSAWRVLEAEHARLRHLLDAIVRSLDDDAWQDPGPQLDLLRARIQEFQDFETRTHRPKGVVLLSSLRGRLAEADRLLDDIEEEGQKCEDLQAQAVTMLESVGKGADPDRAVIASLLRQHCERMRRQLDLEDTALKAYTAQLLTAQEWSRVASSISLEVQRARRASSPAKS